MTSENFSINNRNKFLIKRKNKEKRLKLYGIISISVALIMLFTLLLTITLNGYTALQQAYVVIPVNIKKSKVLDESGEFSVEKSLLFNWDSVVKKTFRKYYPELNSRNDKRILNKLLSSNAGYDLKRYFYKNQDLLGKNIKVWLPLSDNIDQYLKGRIDISLPEDDRNISDLEISLIKGLVDKDLVKLKFNKSFFTSADSREPESAGILGAVVGSMLTLFVTVLAALPIAVMASIYLEYFSKPGKITDFIEVNINNLAAVPSIVFGLLGLSIFLGLFGMPRSIPLVGGFVLALMTIPTIIIATRASIRAVPPSIKDAALGLGASKMQAALHHVIPLATPGILTGTIIGMAQALGESAPLLMIGMVAFIIDVPTGVTSSATVLPVQIFMWADSAERAFYERSSLAILILVVFLIFMNLTAVIIRRKTEKNW